MDNTNQCWLCGKKAMESEGSYYRCTACGSTWNEQPRGGVFIDIKTTRDFATGEFSYSPVPRRRLPKPSIRKTKRAKSSGGC